MSEQKVAFMIQNKIYLLNTNHQFFRKSLQFFRGPGYDISEEFEEIKEKRRSKVEMQGEKQSWNWTFKQLMSSSFLKPYSCVGVLYILCDWSGFSAFSTYMVQILKESGLSIDPRIGPITIGSIRLFYAGKTLLHIVCIFPTFITVFNVISLKTIFFTYYYSSRNYSIHCGKSQTQNNVCDLPINLSIIHNCNLCLFLFEGI